MLPATGSRCTFELGMEDDLPVESDPFALPLIKKVRSREQSVNRKIWEVQLPVFSKASRHSWVLQSYRFVVGNKSIVFGLICLKAPFV